MSFYASIVDRTRACLAVGPFRRHGDALAAADAVHAWVRDNRQVVGQDSVWWGFGTCQHKTSHAKPGKLNERLGVRLDDDGFVDRASSPWVTSGHGLR